MPGEAELIQQARELYRALVQLHIQSEQQWIPYIILGIPLGLLFFLALTRKEQGAHLSNVWDKIRFFFSPYAPENFVVILDPYGWHVGYNAQIIPGKRFHIVKFKGKEYRVLDDPLRWAVPSSLLDMKGPPGIPSPFGLVARMIVAWMVAVVIVAAAWSQTAYISYFAYKIQPTWIDVASTAAFIVVVAWFLRNILELHRSTGMVLELWAIPPTNIVIPVTPGPRSLKEWKELLLRSVDAVSGAECDACRKLAEKLKNIEDEEAAAQIVAMAVDAENWRKRYAELEEQLDKHIEAAEAAALRLPTSYGTPASKLWRWLPWIVMAAIVIGVIALIVALQPSVHPATNTTSTTMHAASPAQPPQPPVHAPTHTPAQPPPPPSNTTG